MRISNSSFKSWFTCPELFHQRYIEGVQKGNTPSYLVFGTRFHDMLQAHYSGISAVGVGYIYSTHIDPLLEAEAQAMLAAYRAHYPQEPFKVLETEKNFEIRIPNTQHTLVGRIDALLEQGGKLLVMEDKTENRNSKRNLPQAWMARSQASLYVWAASEIYNKPIDSVLLNICTRGTEKGNIGPSFRRDLLHRSPQQVADALADVTWVADAAEALEGKRYPRNTESCVSERGYQCDLYAKCHMGSEEGLVTISPYSYLGIT